MDESIARSALAGEWNGERRPARSPGRAAWDEDILELAIELRWPDYVITDRLSGRRWRVNGIEAHILSVVDGRRSVPRLVSAARDRIRRTMRGAAVGEEELLSAFLRLSRRNILTGNDNRIGVRPRFAAITRGSLDGSVAALLARSPGFPDEG